MPKRIVEKVEFLEGEIISVRCWLATFGKGSKKERPQHDIDVKNRKLEFLKEIRNDYALLIERANARGAA